MDSIQRRKKFRVRDTKNLSTDADSRTDTILERLHNLSLKEEENNDKNLDFFVGGGVAGEGPTANSLKKKNLKMPNCLIKTLTLRDKVKYYRLNDKNNIHSFCKKGKCSETVATTGHLHKDVSGRGD